MDELTSSEYFLRLTDDNTYGINTIKNPYSSENKEKIAVVPFLELALEDACCGMLIRSVCSPGCMEGLKIKRSRQRPPRAVASRSKSLVLVLIGVSGSGKSTIGKLLGRALGCRFYEGDDFHSEANKGKMRAGIPLTDADRRPWLTAIRRLISKLIAGGQNAVVACSALKESYRDYLRRPGVRFIYLKGSYCLFQQRLQRRRGHFFDPHLLASQFETLEEPRNALVIDVDREPASVVSEILEGLDVDSAAKVMTA